MRALFLASAIIFSLDSSASTVFGFLDAAGSREVRDPRFMFQEELCKHWEIYSKQFFTK
jgi:hypothetical protein